jgi:hypothetical protein
VGPVVVPRAGRAADPLAELIEPALELVDRARACPYASTRRFITRRKRELLARVCPASISKGGQRRGRYLPRPMSERAGMRTVRRPMLARVWSWLSRTGRRLGVRLQGDKEQPRDVDQARARFWAELREGQREAEARMPTRQG